MELFVIYSNFVENYRERKIFKREAKLRVTNMIFGRFDAKQSFAL